MSESRAAYSVWLKPWSPVAEAVGHGRTEVLYESLRSATQNCWAICVSASGSIRGQSGIDRCERSSLI